MWAATLQVAVPSVRHLTGTALIMRASWRAGHDAAQARRRFVTLMRSPSTIIGLAPASPSKTFREMASVPAFAKGFPDSTAVPSAYFKWPGTTESSTQEVRRILQENDRKYDIYEKVRCECGAVIARFSGPGACDGTGRA